MVLCLLGTSLIVGLLFPSLRLVWLFCFGSLLNVVVTSTVCWLRVYCLQLLLRRWTAFPFAIDSISVAFGRTKVAVCEVIYSLGRSGWSCWCGRIAESSRPSVGPWHVLLPFVWVHAFLWGKLWEQSEEWFQLKCVYNVIGGGRQSLIVFHCPSLYIMDTEAEVVTNKLC